MKINYSIRNNIATASLFFFNDTATTEIYTLSLHDALPISLDVTEELRLHQGLWDRAAVDRDERPVPAGALRVDGAGDELLAGAALARDEHGGQAVGGLPDGLGDLWPLAAPAHGGGAAPRAA